MEKDLINKLSLQQKTRILIGKDMWNTEEIEQPYVPGVMVTDGPHGLRKQTTEQASNINESAISTCFPTACATASSWDIDIARQIGDCIGKEALHEQVSTVLGPGVNIKRSPLGGRNFEYFSEDPYLAGRMGSAWIDGVQSNKVGTSLKHFALNSQEKRRMTVDSVADQRTLREIYLPAFEYAVKNSQPTTIMAAYNKINGVSCTQNKYLLMDILRKEWGFSGLVVSDWGATYDVVECIRNGMDLQMPGGSQRSALLLQQAVERGVLSEQELNRAVTNMLKFAFERKVNLKENYEVDYAQHHLVAKDCATESAVLLKNDGILPLNKKKEVLVVGELAKNMRFQGSGSSHINTVETANLLDAMQLETVKFEYVQGYSINDDKLDESMPLTEDAQNLQKTALYKAQNYDTVIFCGGLTDQTEGEGYDRESFNLPVCQTTLIAKLCQSGKKVIFVSFGGSPYAMPWAKDVSAILNMYLCGQGAGEATCELLYGVKNPCGKLAETWPINLQDTPCYDYFLTKTRSAEHREGIFVGYRYYDTFNVPTLFDFGYGLSYTQFVYTDFVVKKNNVHNYTVKVTVKNVGTESGKEIVQLYIAAPTNSTIIHARRQLKGFIKTDLLAPNEQQEIEFTLDKRSFAYYDVEIGDWQVEKGDYTIEVSASLHDTRCSKTVAVEGITPHGEREIYSDYFALNNGKLAISEQQFIALTGRELVSEQPTKKGSFTTLNTFEEVEHLLIIKIIKHFIRKEALKSSCGDINSPVAKMIISGCIETPMVSMPNMSNGRITEAITEGIVYMANGRFFKGLLHCLKRR